jgi:transposase
MLSVPASVSIFLHAAATDMRKGIDGLSGIVRGEFGGDPLDGSLYLFVVRRGG